MTDPKDMNNLEWKEKLTEEQYRVLRMKGTERAFTGEYDNHFEKGEYVCAGCGTKLFTDEGKYNSGCGWPAFHTASDKANILEETDDSLGMRRTEVLCSACNGHLGHVFPDGPREHGGMRYCINSAALQFKARE